MNRRTKALLILTFVLTLLSSSVIYIILAPGRWTREIVNYVNQSLLLDSGWDLSVSDLTGRLTSDLRFENVYLRNKHTSVILFFETGDLNLDFSQIMSGNWALSNLLIDNLLVTIKEKETPSNISLDFTDEMARNGLQIKTFLINRSSIRVKEDGISEKLYSFDASGRITSDNGVINVSIASANFHDFQSTSELSISDANILIDAFTVTAKDIVGKLNGFEITAEGTAQFGQDRNFSLRMGISDVPVETFSSWYISEIIDATAVDLNMDIEKDINIAHADVQLLNTKTSNLIADLKTNIIIDNDNIHFSNSNITINDARFYGSGRFEEKSALLLDLYVSDLDLKKFGLSAKATGIEGTTRFDIDLEESNELAGITAHIALQNGNFASPEFLSVSGRIDYRDGIISVPDSLTINLGLGTLQAYGEIDIDLKKTDLVLVLQETDLSIVASFAGIEGSPQGLAFGTVHFSGFLDDPSMKGNITIDKASYGVLEVSSIKSNFIINSVVKTRHGSLAAEAGKSIVGDLNIDVGSLNLYFMGDTVLIANASATSGDEYLRFSGKIVDFNTIHIDQIQSSLKDQFISNLGPFSASYNEGRAKIGPARFKINEGLLETELEFSHGLLKEGDFHMVNIDLLGIGNLLGRALPVKGAAFADFTAKTIDDELSLNGSFQIRDGIWEEMVFDDLLITANINGEHITIEEMQLRRGQDLALDISGFYTAEMKNNQFLDAKPNGNLSFSSRFKDFDLGLLSPYLPEWWNIKGAATGSFAMGGSSSDSELSFALTIDEPRFSRLKAEQIKATGRYSDHRLYFEDFIGLTRTGEYRGEGYIPIDLDIKKDDADRWIESDPISMNFTSRTSSMEFLSPFFTYIDSVIGTIEVDLSIEGTPAKPVRNGEINITNGEVFYTWLDTPVSGINGRAFLKDNMLIVEELTATSNIPEDTNWGQNLRANLARVYGGKLFREKKEEVRNNIRITGSMDMTSFFDPNLALLIKGQNVYVRTLLGEIEGIGDIELSITGRDTINIAGDIVPEEAVLRMEFTGGEDYSEMPMKGGTVYNYRLNFPISDKLFVRNSQIDAEVSGNMSIQKIGNEPYRYAGELDVVTGKFYYFSDVFNIQEGNLAFDPTELNPKLNIQATTDISGEQILVSLTGTLDDPVLVLEHSDNFFSQEDLLQLLTLQKRFDNNAADELRQQSAFLFGKFLENELEKSLARSNPLFDEFEIEGSTAFIDPTGQEDVAVKVGTRLTSNLSLSYKRSFSLANPNQVGVEYRLNRNVSLVVTYDDDGQVHLKYRRKYRF